MTKPKRILNQLPPMESYREKVSRTKGRVDRTGHKIQFLLSYKEWEKIWKDSGHWMEWGSWTGQYVMSRYDDLGDYIVGNVFIQLSSENVAESNRRRTGELSPVFGRPKTASQLEQSSANGKAMAKREIKCEHCNKVGYGLSMLRWHGKHCTYKTV